MALGSVGWMNSFAGGMLVLASGELQDETAEGLHGQEGPLQTL